MDPNNKTKYIVLASIAVTFILLSLCACIVHKCFTQDNFSQSSTSSCTASAQQPNKPEKTPHVNPEVIPQVKPETVEGISGEGLKPVLPENAADGEPQVRIQDVTGNMPEQPISNPKIEPKNSKTKNPCYAQPNALNNARQTDSNVNLTSTADYIRAEQPEHTDKKNMPEHTESPKHTEQSSMADKPEHPHHQDHIFQPGHTEQPIYPKPASQTEPLEVPNVVELPKKEEQTQLPDLLQEPNQIVQPTQLDIAKQAELPKKGDRPIDIAKHNISEDNASIQEKPNLYSSDSRQTEPQIQHHPPTRQIPQSVSKNVLATENVLNQSDIEHTDGQREDSTEKIETTKNITDVTTQEKSTDEFIQQSRLANSTTGENKPLKPKGIEDNLYEDASKPKNVSNPHDIQATSNDKQADCITSDTITKQPQTELAAIGPNVSEDSSRYTQGAHTTAHPMNNTPAPSTKEAIDFEAVNVAKTQGHTQKPESISEAHSDQNINTQEDAIQNLINQSQDAQEDPPVAPPRKHRQKVLGTSTQADSNIIVSEILEAQNQTTANKKYSNISQNAENRHTQDFADSQQTDTAENSRITPYPEQPAHFRTVEEYYKGQQLLLNIFSNEVIFDMRYSMYEGLLRNKEDYYKKLEFALREKLLTGFDITIVDDIMGVFPKALQAACSLKEYKDNSVFSIVNRTKPIINLLDCLYRTIKVLFDLFIAAPGVENKKDLETLRYKYTVKLDHIGLTLGRQVTGSQISDTLKTENLVEAEFLLVDCIFARFVEWLMVQDIDKLSDSIEQ